MFEILVWGDITKEFERLGINPKCSWSGTGWSPDDDMYVYELTEAEFQTLINDPKPDEEWMKENCAWRHSKGSNMTDPIKRRTINGKYIKAWSDPERDIYGVCPFDHLLRYFCDHVGISQPRNVTALAVDLAKINGLTMAQLFAKYQSGRKCK